jgi:transcriptional regulator with PAS, ATPase and Fis domain
VDCAVLAATNQDLEKFIKEGRFRRDLLYRLNTFTIRIPPLRDRCEDIFELTNYFLAKYNRSFNRRKKMAPLAMDLLQSHSFPGNVRELKSIIKRAVCLTESDVLDESILETSGAGLERVESRREVSDLPLRVHQAEKEEIERGVSRCRTTRELARYLGVSQPTAVRKLKKHGFGRLDSKAHQKKI